MRLMSSFVENSAWYATFDLGVFDWSEWIATIPLPMPVYDISRILDSAAAFDMAMHARHWTGTHLEGLRIPDALRHHMNVIGITSLQQHQYMARALYSHCARYVTGMPRIREPPTDHMGTTAVVPPERFEALATAVMANDPCMRRTLECWGYCCSVTLCPELLLRHACGHRMQLALAHVRGTFDSLWGGHDLGGVSE